MMINRDLIAVIGQPVRVGSLNGTITLRAITPEPLELGLIIGGPIGARAHHLAARQRLGQTIGAELGFVAVTLQPDSWVMMYTVAVKSASV